MKFSFYSIWMDYSFYVYLLIFLGSVIAFLFALRKLLELKSEENQEPEFSEILSENPDSQNVLQESVNTENANTEIARSNTPFSNSENIQPQLFPKPEEKPNLSPAEEFIKNLYTAISNIDERMKNIEKNLTTKKSVNNEFIIKFLEDILNDYDSLDKEKIKGRLKFLISDLKNQ